jgi:hypothetical protein
MAKLTCNCGYAIEDVDHYKVEGNMWAHAMRDHLDNLKGMSGEQIAEWLKNADKEMGVA